MFHLGTHGYLLSIRTILVYIAFLNQPQIGCDAHGFSDVFRLQLLEDVLLVILHGVGVDEEGGTYLGVGEALDGELQDVPLAFIQYQRRLFAPAAGGEGIDVAVSAGLVRDEDIARLGSGRQGDHA